MPINQRIEIADEGSIIAKAPRVVDFVGAGVTATADNPNKVTITIPGAAAVTGWTDGGTIVYVTTTTDSVAIGATTLTGSEKLRVAGSYSLEGASAASLITSASQNLTISTTTSGTIAVTSAGAINHTSAAASTWAHSGGAFAITSTGQNLTISTATSGTLAVTSAGALNLTGVAASTFAFSGGAFALTVTGQNCTISTATSGTLALSSAGAATLDAATSVTVGGTNATSVKIGRSGQSIGFFAASATTVQTVGAVTNSVTSGGSDGTIADFSDLTIYSNSAAAIRNNLYQLARSVGQCTAALRNLGLGA